MSRSFDLLRVFGEVTGVVSTENEEILMATAKTVGRTIGILLLVQVVGLTVAFSLLKPAVTTDYVTQMPTMETGVRTAVMLLFLNAAITVWMSIAAFSIIREYSVRLAIALVAAGTLWAAVQSMDNAHLMSMLSMSERYTDGAEILAAQVRSTRVFVHFTTLLLIDVWFAVFYWILFRFRLVPRWLGAIGLVAVAMHLIGIALPAFIGYSIIWPLAYGFGFSYLVFGGWLVWRGFADSKEAGFLEAS
jgi:hypothetical protein